jgi:hypothetical protein
MRSAIGLQVIVAAAVLAACDSGGKSDESGAGGDGSGAGAPTSGPGGPGGTTTGAGPSTGTGAGGSIDPGKVPMFIAQGSAGRTTVSCDDGHTWVGDHSWDVDADPLMCGMAQSARCYENDCSYMIGGECTSMQCCDHSPDVAKGVIWGNGKFVATWGWGQPGAVRTSTNGIDWATTHGNDTFGGLAYGAGRFVVASRFPFWSEDGTSWTAGETADFTNSDGSDMWSVRRFAYSDYDGGRFIAVASGDTNRDMLVSSDGGVTWWRPSVLPDDCAGEVSTYGGIVSGNGVTVIVDMDGNACRSTDGGDTWSVVPTGLTQVLSHGVWTGSEFWFWGDDSTRISSPDGVTWTQTPMTTPRRLGPVARSPEGTLVAVGNVWEGYEDLSFYRSTDGLEWEELAAGTFVPSHSIFYMAFGYADPSDVCPAP